jgi:hypothetical protein
MLKKQQDAYTGSSFSKYTGSTNIVIYFILCLFNNPLCLAIANSNLVMDCYTCKLIIKSRNQGHTQDFTLVMVVVATGVRGKKGLGSKLLQSIFLGGVTNVI